MQKNFQSVPILQNVVLSYEYFLCEINILRNYVLYVKINIGETLTNNTVQFISESTLGEMVKSTAI